MGYKPTVVGMIPKDWHVTTLGAVGSPLSGGTPRKSDDRFWGGDIPWVTSKDMKMPRLRSSTSYVTPVAVGNGTRLVKPGTILMVVRGMVLAHSFPVAIAEVPLTFNQDLKALVPREDLNGEFILRWLEASKAKILLLATEATHGTKRLPSKDLFSSLVALPERTEQRAIVQALSDADELLDALEELIAKKRAIKQAAMQQLLTGRTRLPGFNGEWVKSQLGEIGTFAKGRGIRRNEVTDEGLPCISSVRL